MEASTGLAEIFAASSDEEDFRGFNVPSPAPPSEESCDGSVSTGKLGLRFRSRYVTEELIRIFSEETDSEEEEFEGFTWDGSPRPHFMRKSASDSDSDGDTGFNSEAESQPPVRMRSTGLRVAFRFPHKKSPVLPVSAPCLGSKARRAGGGAKRNGTKEEDGQDGEEDEAQCKRARNIQQNKEMLAKLFADLQSMTDLSPVKTPTRKRASPKKRQSEEGNERRNPTRRARPPEHFAREETVETKPGKTGSHLRGLDVSKLLEVRGDLQRCGKKRSRMRGEVRPVDDITEEELENVALRAKDKILDKERGTTCHQCRQKTLDTKTICRNPFCCGVKGQFCGPCLRNRYGEDVRTALLDPDWECPLCRGICNCSLCRKRDGRCATGALAHMAKYYGHGSVREYLDSLQRKLC